MNDSDNDNDRDVEQAALLDRALEWLVVTRDPDVDPARLAALQAWLAAAPEHRRAWRQAEEISALGDRAALLLAVQERSGGAAETVSIASAGRDRSRALALRRWRPALAIAACLPLVLAVLLLVWRDPGWTTRAFADHAVAAGPGREVTLVDGSRLFLDGDSAFDVDFSASDRRIELRRGRVWLDVVRDGRPFLVEANGVEVAVLGTRFAVERNAQSVDVSVEQGRVGVSAQGGERVVLEAWQRVEVDAGRLGGVTGFEPAVGLAWRRGLMIFDRADIDTVVRELERARPGRVLVLDRDRLEQRRFSATFARTEPSAVLQALPSALGVNVFTLPDGSVVLSERRGEGN